MSTEADTLVFVYGENPAIDELDPIDEELVIVTRHAAEKVSKAYTCRTWGEYADLCGQSWAGLLEDYGGEVRELTGLEDPPQDAPFEFSRVYGLYYVADLIPEPRTAAYAALVKLPRTVRQDSRLRDMINWSGGSPAGHISSVTARSEKAVRLLEQVIHEAGYIGYRFERDDALVSRVMGY
jgi:hypothetical protein